MIDKQIIKECSFKGECQMMGCLNDENCYIKQLFGERYRAERELYRKEQECEELKEEAIKRSKELIRIRKERQEGQKMNRNLHKQLDQLKAENEKLDTENKRLVAELANPVFDSFEELDQLKASLQEIKEIAEKQRNGCDFYWSCEKCTYYCYSKQILQKISEVEDV